MRRLWAVCAVLAALSACSDSQKIDPTQQVGPHPLLPKINEPVAFPRTNIPKVVGWKAGEAPVVPRGFRVEALVRGLTSPRNVYALPNGDILVVQSAKEGKEPVERLKNVFFNLLFARAHGAAGPTNRILLLRDANGDGKPELQSVLIDHLNAPFGVVQVGDKLYVAETDKIMRYAFTPGQTKITDPGEKLVDLPAGIINHHWTKSLTASADGSRLFVGVGSNSNIGDRGTEAETDRAAILEVDPKTGAQRVFASGLRNPNGLNFYPGSDVLWTVVNERDELGNNLVPDYLTSVRRGAFYGWPYSYYGQHLDPRVRPQRPDLVARAIPPDYALSSHVAPLGLAFYTGSSFPTGFHGGAFVAEHGSWNRAPLNGYRIVFIRFAGGRPVGLPATFAAGFVNADGKVRGRPVGLAIDRSGSLLIADDAGGAVWRVSYAGR